MGGAKKEGGMDTCCSHTGPRLPGGEESPHCMKHLGQGSANYVYIRVSGHCLFCKKGTNEQSYSFFYVFSMAASLRQRQTRAVVMETKTVTILLALYRELLPP